MHIPSLIENLPFKLLMVEDNMADIKLMLEAIRITGLKTVAEVDYAQNAEDGYKFLHRGYLAQRPYDIITIDLNMPRISGKEMLATLKNDPRYASIPVFIISNSDSVRDMSDCYNLGANGYIQKPSELKRLLDFFEAVKYTLVHDGHASADNIDRRYEELKLLHRG
jgi:CheY-like chemotaxis protein